VQILWGTPLEQQVSKQADHVGKRRGSRRGLVPPIDSSPTPHPSPLTIGSTGGKKLRNRKARSSVIKQTEVVR